MLKRDSPSTNPETDSADDSEVADRIAELERLVEVQQAEIRDLAERNSRPAPRSGVRRGRCVHCENGWIIEDQANTRLVCDTCDYIRYF